jgi:hypothetical protein
VHPDVQRTITTSWESMAHADKMKLARDIVLAKRVYRAKTREHLGKSIDPDRLLETTEGTVAAWLAKAKERVAGVLGNADLDPGWERDLITRTALRHLTDDARYRAARDTVNGWTTYGVVPLPSAYPDGPVDIGWYTSVLATEVARWLADRSLVTRLTEARAEATRAAEQKWSVAQFSSAQFPVSSQRIPVDVQFRIATETAIVDAETRMRVRLLQRRAFAAVRHVVGQIRPASTLELHTPQLDALEHVCAGLKDDLMQRATTEFAVSRHAHAQRAPSKATLASVVYKHCDIGRSQARMVWVRRCRFLRLRYLFTRLLAHLCAVTSRIQHLEDPAFRARIDTKGANLSGAPVVPWLRDAHQLQEDRMQALVADDAARTAFCVSIAKAQRDALIHRLTVIHLLASDESNRVFVVPRREGSQMYRSGPTLAHNRAIPQRAGAKYLSAVHSNFINPGSKLVQLDATASQRVDSARECDVEELRSAMYCAAQDVVATLRSRIR